MQKHTAGQVGANSNSPLLQPERRQEQQKPYVCRVEQCVNETEEFVS